MSRINLFCLSFFRTGRMLASLSHGAQPKPALRQVTRAGEVTRRCPMIKRQTPSACHSSAVILWSLEKIHRPDRRGGTLPCRRIRRGGGRTERKEDRCSRADARVSRRLSLKKRTKRQRRKRDRAHLACLTVDRIALCKNRRCDMVIMRILRKFH